MVDLRKPPVTQRAYTLRLRGADPNDDKSWRDALWLTHKAINDGAKVFGDWLLTLRGGLDHTLADTVGKSSDGKQRVIDKEEIKARRILLALSWLSVESVRGAPEKYIVTRGTDSDPIRHENVKKAFENILEKRGLTDEEIKEWKQDCIFSLTSAIRKDAVWVNRSAAFDASSFKREDIWDMLGRFFNRKETYLSPEKIEDESDKSQKEEKTKDLVKKAGEWLSSRFGTGKGADFERMVEIYGKIASWAENVDQKDSHSIDDLVEELQKYFFIDNPEKEKGFEWIKKLSSYWGHAPNPVHLLLSDNKILTGKILEDLKNKANKRAESCKEKANEKGQKSYANTILADVESVCGFTYLTDKNGHNVSILDSHGENTDRKWGSSRHSVFAVILDHSARRVSIAHTWIKRAEAERRMFEKDTKKADQIADNAKKWLNEYCQKRKEISGSLEEYRIRKRAISGWEKIVEAWSDITCKTKDDRIAVVRKLQDQEDIDKFGDAQLFESLSQDDALCAWHKNGDIEDAPDHQILINYVDATEAEFKKRNFKVPAYRHPDELLHPVFCDFGNSRLDIDFSIRETSNILKKKEMELEIITNNIEKLRSNLNQNNENESEVLHIRKQEKLKAEEGRLANIKREIEYLVSAKRMRMYLWNGQNFYKTNLYWQSKRFYNDIITVKPDDLKGKTDVVRADRLGLASSSAKRDEAVIAGLFEQNYWNGRLQAPRKHLVRIAAIRDKSNFMDSQRENKIKALVDRIPWIVTFSPKLQPIGPWFEYVKQHQIKTTSDFWPVYEGNKTRNGQARLILSRLPNLRVLSVDLGHRQAAACVVWEVLDVNTVKKACQDAGHIEPKEKDLFLHLKTKEKKIIKGQEVIVDKTTIYRRIGPDVLPDGTPHPGPWARLDRQFFIKLQGEEAVRMASNEEIWMVHKLESDLGRSMPLIDRLVKSGWGKTCAQRHRLDALRKKGWKPLNEINPSDDANGGNTEVADGATDEEIDINKPSLSVDDLVTSAIRTMRLALKRQGDRARIAFTMHKNYKPMPGDRKYYFDEAKDASINDDSITRENKHTEYIQEALNVWYNMFSSRTWKDEQAKKLWEDYIEAKVFDYEDLEKIDEDLTDSDQKEKLKANQEKLRKIAEQVKNFRNELYVPWEKEWNDKNQYWKRQLRWFKDWLQPRKGLDNKIDPAIRGMGGLSLTRIASLIEFRRKVQTGFFNRLHPDGTHAEITEQFGQKILDALENLREQRVKQLSSRIVEAALGLGRMQKDVVGKDRKRPAVQVDRPCHAIVIENLKNYRPDQTQTRRENRQLMAWSSSKILKYLTELCQLYGLHLREVSAAYTSRQDSRTGAPGIRCQDVSIKEFMRSAFWRKQVAHANKLKNARDHYIQNLDIEWKGKSEEDWNRAGVARTPLNGGEIFVSADSNSPAAKGLQADLNAAANIGLRALTDPDWPGKWWYIPVDSKKMQPIVDKVKGCAALEKNGQIIELGIDAITAEEIKPKKKDRKKSSDVINLWCDISSTPLNGRDKGVWKTFTDYQENVENRVISILTARNKKRPLNLR